MKILKMIGVALGVLVAGALLAYLFRGDPIAMLAGKRLSGEEVAYPTDWSFTRDHMTIAVETRPDDPHSVTTICFVYNGDLYVPAQGGSAKDWPQYVVADRRVRLKVGDAVYPVAATRVTDLAMADIASAAAAKYPQMAGRAPEDMPKDVWLFRIAPRQAGPR